MQARYRLGAYVAGATAARTGDEMSGPGLLLLGLSTTGSVAIGSALLAAVTVSSGVAGPVLGATLDRVRAPGHLLAMLLGGYAACLGLVAALLGPAPAPVLIALAALAGCAAPALTGAWTAQLPRIASAEQLQRGFGLDVATYSTASLFGPALAGGTASVLGARVGLAVAVALLLAAVPAALRFPHRERGDAARTGLTVQLRAGFRLLITRPALARITAASMISFAGFGAFVVACPLIGLRLAGDAASGTLLLSTLAVGSVLATALLTRYPWRGRPETLAVGAFAVLGAAFVGLALGGSFALAALVAFCAGIAEGPLLTAVFQIRHREAPPALSGQVFTTAASLKTTSFALGSLVAGALGHAPSRCLVGAAGAQLAAILVLLRGRREHRVASRSRS